MKIQFKQVQLLHKKTLFKFPNYNINHAIWHRYDLSGSPCKHHVKPMPLTNTAILQNQVWEWISLGCCCKQINNIFGLSFSSKHHLSRTIQQNPLTLSRLTLLVPWARGRTFAVDRGRGKVTDLWRKKSFTRVNDTTSRWGRENNKSPEAEDRAALPVSCSSTRDSSYSRVVQIRACLPYLYLYTYSTNRGGWKVQTDKVQRCCMRWGWVL